MRINNPAAGRPAQPAHSVYPGWVPRAVPARAAGGRQPIPPGEPPQPRRRPSGPLHEFDQPLRQQPACERERAGDRFVVPGVMARWCRSKTPGHHAGRGRGSGRPQTGLRPTRCPPAPADRRARPPAARFADLEASTAGAGTSPRRNLPAAPDRPWPGSGSPRTAAPTLQVESRASICPDRSTAVTTWPSPATAMVRKPVPAPMSSTRHGAGGSSGSRAPCMSSNLLPVRRDKPARRRRWKSSTPKG